MLVDPVRRVRLEPDGTVTVATGKVELGQGIRTALAQIVAEELGVPLGKIRMLPPSTEHSPDEGVTSGSLSVQEGGRALREACLELRGGPEKPPAEYRVVGTSVPRLDLPAKLAGKPSYLHDMAFPGMLHGRVVRPPRPFVRLVSAPEMPNVVRDGGFLAVLAEREEDAVAAAAKLKAKCVWEEARLPEDIHAWLKANVTERIVTKEQADAQARARGVKRLKAAYTKPYVCHASIGPSCALARWQGGRLEVWSHTQGIFNLRRDLAKTFGLGEAAVVVRHAEGAGCYGHNGADDVALDAALLARTVPGKWVRVQWMRDDEFAWEPYGPAMAFELEAALDGAGRVVSWRHEFWSNGHTNRPGRAPQPAFAAVAHLAKPMGVPPAVDPPLPAGGSDRNAIPTYDFPDLLVRKNYVRETPLRSSSLRSLGAFGNVFAVESFMDECAAAAGVDPVTFRLNHLKDPRARAVIGEIAPLFRSFRKTENRGRGIAFARYKTIGAYCAVLAEVEAAHELRCTRLVAAVDVGLVVNPDGVANQVEGGCVQAASWALKEAFRPGAAGWEDYPILKFSEVPQVEVLLVRNHHPSVGAGECMMGPTAAAIANALHDALGVRVRDLPLTPERIAAAM